MASSGSSAVDRPAGPGGEQRAVLAGAARQTRGRSALAALLVALAALLLPPQVAGAEVVGATPGTAAVAATLPVSGSVSGSMTSWREVAADPANRAVAAACGLTNGLTSPRWVLLQPPTATTVVARSQATYQQSRQLADLVSGVALVARDDLRVLSCASRTGVAQVGPAVVGPEGAYVVTFQPAQPDLPDLVIDYGFSRSTWVDATTGVPPVNDDLAAAKQVTALPYSDTVDRYEATAEPLDYGWATQNFCENGPERPSTVYATAWYRVTVAEDTVLDPYPGQPAWADALPWLSADVAQVAEMTGGGLASLTCPLTPAVELLRAGRTYYLQVGDYALFGPYSGPVAQGRPRPVTVTGTARLLGALEVTGLSVGVVSLDPRRQVLALSGTVTCTGGGAASAEVHGRVTERRSGQALAVQATVPVVCDGTAQPWRAVVPAAAARLHPSVVEVTLDVDVAGAAGRGSSGPATWSGRTRVARAAAS